MSSAIRYSLLFFFALAVSAQSEQPEPRFALEVQSPDWPQPIYGLVPRASVGRGGTASSWFFPAAVTPPAGEAVSESPKKPCAVTFDYKEDGDAVSIAAFFFFEACDRRPSPEWRQKHPGQPIGNYAMQLNETVTFDEMKKFGLQPYTLKIVNAQIPNPVGPPTSSKVPSLQITIVAEDRQFYKLLVHNLSSQAVTGLVLTRSSPVSGETTQSYEDGKPLILPGASRKYEFSSSKVMCPQPDGSAPDEVPCPIVLGAALFADGTYDGDAEVWAEFEGARLGWTSYPPQLRELVRNILRDSSLSDAKKIEVLRSAIPELPEEPDQAAIDQLRSRYANLPDSAWEKINLSIRSSAGAQKQIILEKLKEFEDDSADFTSTESLAEWLSRRGIGN